jgi:sugar/nucleoside kinase (ribokinase family)
MTEALDVLMFGHFAKDRIVIDERSENFSGGGAYFGSVVYRRLGLSVGVVTRLHRDDFPRLDELTREGIRVFPTAASETTGIENTYKSSDMERRICKPLGFAGPIQTNEVPDVSARVYAITPIIAGEVDYAVLKMLAARGPVALDVQGFVRVPEGDTLVYRRPPELDEGLSYVTYLKVDRAEAEHLTGETDLACAAKKLQAYGPREIVLTQSSGVTVFANGNIYTAPFTPRSLAGRTGRGDTCFASYIGKRLSTAPEEACRWAGAITTLKQEIPGPWSGTLADAERVMASWK